VGERPGVIRRVVEDDDANPVAGIGLVAITN
jgi:hypothetical protein